MRTSAQAAHWEWGTHHSCKGLQHIHQRNAIQEAVQCISFFEDAG